MFPVLILTALAAAQAEPPAKKELFANEKFYKDRKEKEQEYTGVLRYKPRDGVGIGRHNPFTLEMDVKGKKDVREVYIGGKDGLLRPYANKRVKIVGKPVELEVIGKTHREIWPARVELVADKKGASAEPAAEPTKSAVLASTRAWQAFAGGQRGAQQRVITSAADLAKAMGKAGKPEEALAAAAKAFKVPAVDLDKQSIVVITAGTQRSGGYSVEVTGLEATPGQLTVKWRLNRPRPGSPVTLALTTPGVAVLVDKAPARVVFDPPAAANR